jgi:SAM-dependent MidA family methyltransferase
MRTTDADHIDFEGIIARSLTPFSAELSAGAADVPIWRDVFTRMRDLVLDEHATPEQADTFMAAIGRAVDYGLGVDLGAAERAALHDVLWAVFHRHAMPPGGGLAPRADFLKHVNFKALREAWGQKSAKPMRRSPARQRKA